MLEYTLIRSKRRTLSLEINKDLSVVVRAPSHCSDRDIRRFLASREGWLDVHMQRQKDRLDAHPEPSAEESERLIALAKSELPLRVQYYAGIMGVEPSGVKITGAQKRFGSCSSQNSLCFSWRLMAYPEPAIDYVVVHELAHIVHKNHGRDFYELIASALPDYKFRIKLLKG